MVNRGDAWGDDGEDVLAGGGCFGGCVIAGEMFCVSFVRAGDVWGDVWMDVVDDKGDVWGMHGGMF